MSDEPYRLAVILGSVREGRFGPRVADWLREEVIDRRTDLVADHLDLAAFKLPHNLDGGGDSAEFCERLDRADAFVVITPEYNHAFPGALKTAIDTARPEWAGKPAALVSYGGVAGGLRSVELLRLVLTELQVVTIRRALSFHHISHDAETPFPPDPTRTRATADAMLDQLAWWARALRSARQLEGPPEA